jgi:hypothetical protein
LKDESGQVYNLVEQQKRVRAGQRDPYYETIKEPTVFELRPHSMTVSQDLLLVFAEAGLAKDFKPLQLEVPCSAWGRQGTCKFRIAAPYKSRFPAPDK